ncbi:MAG: ParB N-terminal domain-containing protein, partial [Thaumarchaeota archaeon]|nr:ParB N-terminal domain-containing protein [Nitrososphaerota archaeon]
MSHRSMEAREFHLPLDKCRLYPGIPMRFEMGIERLAESIHNHGQQEPGMAIELDDYYLVPDGRRRLLGCRYARYYYGG